MKNPEFCQRTLPSYLCHAGKWTNLLSLIEVATKDSPLPRPALAALALAFALIGVVLSYLPPAGQDGQKGRSTSGL